MTEYKEKSMKLDYNDYIIMPSSYTTIKSRKDIFPFYEHSYVIAGQMKCDWNHLPLITAPMDTVVSENNANLFLDLGINVCYPRGEHTVGKICGSMEFESISLTEFEKLVFETHIPINSMDGKLYICVDIANGHMRFLHDLVRLAKSKFKEKIVIMAGNIANPQTFKSLSECGADYIRVGIGNGNGCFLNGTLIRTHHGYKNIEDIKIGDEILTHRGNYKQVIATTQYYTDEEIYSINDIKCTSNHEYYVINKSDKNLVNEENYQNFAYWVKAKDLDENNHFLLEMDINV